MFYTPFMFDLVLEAGYRTLVLPSPGEDRVDLISVTRFGLYDAFYRSSKML